MAALNESQKMKIASETLEHDWTSTHQAVENIHFLADKFKVSELEAVELAEQSLANARDKALEYKIRLSDCVAAIIFVWASLCILRNSWTPENIKSEGIWYVSIFVVSMIIMTIFSFLLPKRPQLLVKSTRWWAVTLTTILTVLFPFFIEYGKTNQNLYKLVSVLFFALLMLALLRITGFFLENDYKRSEQKSSRYDNQRQILLQAALLLCLNAKETKTGGYSSHNSSMKNWRFLFGVIGGSLCGYYLGRSKDPQPNQ